MSAGILAPKATPASIIDTISTKTRDILAEKDFPETLLKAGFEPVLGSTPDSAAKHFQKERAFWAPVIASLKKQGS